MIVYHMSRTLKCGDTLILGFQKTEVLCEPFIQALERSKDCFYGMLLNGKYMYAVLRESNLAVLRANSRGMKNVVSFQGDATNLSRFSDNSFDVTLSFGPMYHLYEAEEVDRAIDEAIRVTKPGGVMFFAFISVFAIMYANYFYGNWTAGQKENFTDDYQVQHFKEQLFTGYDVTEFESLFQKKPVDWITTTGVDGLLEPIEKRPDFSLSEGDFKALAEWYLVFSEKRELLGTTNHLLYICRKRL